MFIVINSWLNKLHRLQVIVWSPRHRFIFPSKLDQPRVSGNVRCYRYSGGVVDDPGGGVVDEGALMIGDLLHPLDIDSTFWKGSIDDGCATLLLALFYVVCGLPRGGSSALKVVSFDIALGAEKNDESDSASVVGGVLINSEEVSFLPGMGLVVVAGSTAGVLGSSGALVGVFGFCFVGLVSGVIFLTSHTSCYPADTTGKIVEENTFGIRYSIIFWDICIELRNKPSVAIMNSAVDDDNKMNHNSIVVYPSNNGLGEARPSTISATTTKGTEWMTDDVKRTFIVQFRKYGTVKQRRFLNRKYKDVDQMQRLYAYSCDMNITAAQYQDLFSWYIQVKNQVDYGLPKNIRFCSMYTDSETFKDTIAKKRISNEEALIMDQGIDGIEYTSIGSRSGQRIPDEDFHPETHMLHNSEIWFNIDIRLQWSQ
ncbi:hypothetical protein F5051DRAFT_426212 [Lentinula edodes]|nr:hypothetical protein F5051DRAFT_426212 [Lentinula edodes]